MERINRQRAPKGSVTVRQKGNSYEARVTLELVAIMEGVDKTLDYREQLKQKMKQGKD